MSEFGSGEVEVNNDAEISLEKQNLDAEGEESNQESSQPSMTSLKIVKEIHLVEGLSYVSGRADKKIVSVSSDGCDHEHPKSPLRRFSHYAGAAMMTLFPMKSINANDGFIDRLIMRAH